MHRISVMIGWVTCNYAITVLTMGSYSRDCGKDNTDTSSLHLSCYTHDSCPYPPILELPTPPGHALMNSGSA